MDIIIHQTSPTQVVKADDLGLRDLGPTYGDKYTYQQSSCLIFDILMDCKVQRQAAVTAYLKSKQLLLFALERQLWPTHLNNGSRVLIRWRRWLTATTLL